MAVITRALGFFEKQQAIKQVACWMTEQYECELPEAAQIARVTAEKVAYRPMATNGSLHAIDAFSFKLKQFIDQEYAS